MNEVSASDIQELQPYGPDQFRAGLERLLKSPILAALVRDYFSGVELSSFVKMTEKLPTVDDFQVKVIAPAIDAMLKQGSDGITVSGLENLTRDGKYLFISNHRDIICDPALLTQRLCVNGYGTPRICLGDNLLTGSFVVDLIKMNKGVTVKRGLTPRELLRWSHALSELISRSIRQKQDSVWIAQREGRTKNGDDRTHPGVLKMLTMSGEGSLIERFASLRILPVSISYEFDPCDIFKARELYLKESGGGYVKRPGEDHMAMVASIRGFKGRIEIGLGREMTTDGDELKRASALENKKEQLHSLAESVDRQIHRLYRIWPSNWIAQDLLAGKNAPSDRYTREQKERFESRLEKCLATLEPALQGEPQRAGVRGKLLESYARPVLNKSSGG